MYWNGFTGQKAQKRRHEGWAFHTNNEKPKVRGKNHELTVKFAGHERIAIVTNYMGNKASRIWATHATGMPL
jgi:hypothetical protein